MVKKDFNTLETTKLIQYRRKSLSHRERERCKDVTRYVAVPPSCRTMRLKYHRCLWILITIIIKNIESRKKQGERDQNT